MVKKKKGSYPERNLDRNPKIMVKKKRKEVILKEILIETSNNKRHNHK